MPLSFTTLVKPQPTPYAIAEGFLKAFFRNGESEKNGRKKSVQVIN